MTRPTLSARAAGLATLALATMLAGSALADGTVNIYSYRQPDIIKPVRKAAKGIVDVSDQHAVVGRTTGRT